MRGMNLTKKASFSNQIEYYLLILVYLILRIASNNPLALLSVS